jgi:hypothetical protein
MRLTLQIKSLLSSVYCIDENEWNGKVSIQLRLKLSK